jgi:hypothetical protein
MPRRLAVVATTLALLGLGASGARAASLDEVVMYSDSGDYIGGGQMRVYHPGNGRISVGGSTSYLTVSVSGGSLGDAYSMDFAAPPGHVLTPGVYDDAQRAPFRESGRPGIDISGDGRGCNEDAGRFEVKAFDVSPAGVLQRLWIVYEQHCEGGTAALFGEVRLGVGGGSGPLATAPTIVRWPVRDQGSPGTVVPVSFGATRRPTRRSAAAGRARASRSASTGPTGTGGTPTSSPATATSWRRAPRTARRATRSTARARAWTCRATVAAATRSPARSR